MRAIILMGPSGGGKSTAGLRFAVEQGCRTTTASADAYPGLYRAAGGLDFSKLGEAHASCFRDYIEAFQGWHDLNGHHTVDLVICDNTNTTAAEIAPYIAAARAYGIEPEIYCVGAHHSIQELAARNTHGTPAHAIHRQLNNLGDLLDTWPPFWPEVQYLP